jgi:two-component system phosphate regulon sensor histidine kinase PhoR
MTEQEQKKDFRVKILILHKIILYGVLLVFVTVGTSTFITVRTETKVLTSKLTYLGKRIAKDIAFGAEKAYSSSNWRLVEKMLAESVMSERSEVIYTRIIKPDGRIYMANDNSFHGDTVDSVFLPEHEKILTNHFFPERKEYGMLLIRPTTIDNKNWYVMVGLSSKLIKATVKRLILHNMISGSFTVLLGAVISFLLAKSISKPITDLTKAAKIISDGNLGHRVTATTNDEIGELAGTFNNMAVKLKKSYAHLEEKMQELAREKELLGITLGGMSEGVIAVDVDKQIVLFNTVAENLTGCKFKEVEGRIVDEVFRIINEQTKEPIENPIDKTLQSGETECGTDCDALVSKDGNECPILVSAAPIRKTDGEVVGVVMVFRDISQEREVSRLKTDFTSSVSHELRTPLTSIKAYTETILRDPDMPDETRQQFLAIIEEESDRLATLIEDLLEVSRIESGTVKIERGIVNIVAIIKKNLTALEPLAEKKNIELEANVSDKLPELQGDESKIESVITNLVNNAIKFTPEHGKISIGAEVANGEMIIRISDTGMGIPREALSKIFERFYRVHRPGKQIQGTGLGLSIVNKIVTMHNGRIEVESELEKGTTFTVILPLAVESMPEVLSARETSTK